MKIQIAKPLVFAALALLMVACQKEETPADTESSQAVLDMESSVTEMSDDALLRTVGTDSNGGDCPVVTFAQPAGTYPNTITVDYGTDGCVGPMGGIRKGQLVIEVTGAYFSEGSVRTLTPQNFSVNDWSITGQRVVTNLGDDDNGHLHWSVEVSANATDPDGATASWQANRIRTLVEGGESEGILDDVYQITGGSTGTNRRGGSFAANITVPLVKRMDCRWISSGVREVSPAGSERTRSIDFGDGTCDNKAMLTLPNGEQREITLRR